MNALSQIRPPKPAFTENEIGDLTGKVVIVTGANTGVGKEVARILYAKSAVVYAAARSEEKATAAINSIKEAEPNAKGRIEFLKLDLGDLTTIKASAAAFLAKESRLDLLINNAGVMMSPQGSVTTQGYELQLGTNCVAPFLFTKLLTPVLVATAKTAPAGSVRVVWVSSSAADVMPMKNGLDMTNLDYKKKDLSPGEKYSVSKVGNYFHGMEMARRLKDAGVVSVALNPGNLYTDLGRHTGVLFKLMIRMATYPAVYGAYTELFAALSSEVTTGSWVVPWGRFLPIRTDIANAAVPESEGGLGLAGQFWEWSEEQVKAYV